MKPYGDQLASLHLLLGREGQLQLPVVIRQGQVEDRGAHAMLENEGLRCTEAGPAWLEGHGVVELEGHVQDGLPAVGPDIPAHLAPEALPEPVVDLHWVRKRRPNHLKSLPMLVPPRPGIPEARCPPGTPGLWCARSTLRNSAPRLPCLCDRCGSARGT